MDFVLEIVADGLFAAVAAVGFAIISNPPLKALGISAFLAAIGHSIRYFLMNAPFVEMTITPASFFAALSIGLLSLPFARFIRCPAEVFAFPSLLPMIPGMFAYRSVQALTYFLESTGETDKLHYIVLFAYNGITTIFVLVALVVGVALPVFMFRKWAFSVTRNDVLG